MLPPVIEEISESAATSVQEELSGQDDYSQETFESDKEIEEMQNHDSVKPKELKISKKKKSHLQILSAIGDEVFKVKERKECDCSLEVEYDKEEVVVEISPPTLDYLADLRRKKEEKSRTPTPEKVAILPEKPQAPSKLSLSSNKMNGIYQYEDGTETEEKAALRIQANVRGYQTRKMLEEGKDQVVSFKVFKINFSRLQFILYLKGLERRGMLSTPSPPIPHLRRVSDVGGVGLGSFFKKEIWHLLFEQGFFD